MVFLQLDSRHGYCCRTDAAANSERGRHMGDAPPPCRVATPNGPLLHTCQDLCLLLGDAPGHHNQATPRTWVRHVASVDQRSPGIDCPAPVLHHAPSSP